MSWKTNKYEKPWKRKGIDKKKNRIVPRIKICEKCKKRRVKYHHRLCDICWKEKNGKSN